MHATTRGAVLGIVLLAASGEAAAQQREFGGTLGASLATLARAGPDDSLESFGSRFGLTFGAFAELPIGHRFSFQIEALFTDKGGSEPFVDPIIVTDAVTSRYKLKYLDLPLLVRVTGPRVGRGTLQAFAGPTVSLRIGATKQAAFEGPGDSGFKRDLESDEIDRFDTGLTFGGGIELDRVRFDARYTIGMADVLTAALETKAANRGFLFTAGFRFF